MRSVRVGVVGFGFMGKMHASIFNQLPHTKLVAVCDVDPHRWEGVEYQGVEFYTDINGLLSRPDIDAVSICVSDKDHFIPTVLAARAGKDIFLEKPITLDLEEARQILREVEKARVKLMIGFLLRFDPRYAGVKELLEQGKIGEVIHIYARRNSPKSEGPARYKGSTPLVFHVTIHDLDLILWYLNQKARSVYAQATSKALKDFRMEDTMFAIIRFQDETLVNLESSWALPDGSATKLDAYMEVLGTQGMARVECGYSELWFSDTASTSFPDTMHWPQVRNQIVGDLKEELAHFACSILQDTPPLVTGEDGIKSLELAWAIQQSIETGKVINL